MKVWNDERHAMAETKQYTTYEKSPPHCCNTMATAIQDDDNPVVYNMRYREYILSLTHEFVIGNMLSVCPWCGTKLPESLRETYFELLENEHGIEPRDIEDNLYILPHEFQSDYWWKRRGL